MSPTEDLPNAASVALVHRGQVLLIQRAFAPWSGLWSLPGGRLEPGESADQCATRELSEELGLTVFALRPVTRMQLGGERRFVLQVFATEAFEGAITPNEEISGHRWLRPENLGTLPVTPHLDSVITRAARMFERS
ncbi:NUDIX hydrolase [Devosia sp.]|uniref:NUDIX hydrolase n=1 Tax=Devosia sp. TaxID=1871048 RepID=UPI003A92B105